jgi:hypothetical protein
MEMCAIFRGGNKFRGIEAEKVEVIQSNCHKEITKTMAAHDSKTHWAWLWALYMFNINSGGSGSSFTRISIPLLNAQRSIQFGPTGPV